jgi:hypothetical protein
MFMKFDQGLRLLDLISLAKQVFNIKYECI